MAAQRDRNGNRDVRPARLAPRFPTEENRTDASGPVTARRIGALCWGRMGRGHARHADPARPIPKPALRRRTVVASAVALIAATTTTAARARQSPPTPPPPPPPLRRSSPSAPPP